MCNAWRKGARELLTDSPMTDNERTLRVGVSLPVTLNDELRPLEPGVRLALYADMVRRGRDWWWKEPGVW